MLLNVNNFNEYVNVKSSKKNDNAYKRTTQIAQPTVQSKNYLFAREKEREELYMQHR